MQYSIINLSEAKSHKDFRIDADFFKPEFKEFYEKVSCFSRLEDFVEDGYRVVYENTKILSKESIKENSAYFLQASDIDTPIIYPERMGMVSEADWQRYPKGRIKKSELLIEVKGKTEKVAIVPEQFPIRTLVSGSLYKMTVQNGEAEFLLAFLLSKYGSAFKERCKTNLMIPFINKDELYNIPIPNFERKLKELLSYVVKTVYQKILESDSIYQKAEQHFLESLGLSDWQPRHQLSFVRSFKEVDASRRIDAEYFQPMYDEVIDAVKAISHNELGELVTYTKGVEVGTDAYTEDGIPFIRVSDISEKGIERTEKTITQELYHELAAKHSPRKGDVLMTKDGTIGRSFVMHENVKAILSGAFLKLKLKKGVKLDKEYLALVINSLVCKQQMEKMSGGAIIAHLKPSDAMKLVIPLLDETIQAEISTKIAESQTKREQSKALLEVAKRGVEMAIEKDETTAQKWIEKQLQELGM